MRVLCTHHKQDHPGWRSRVDIPNEWRAYLEQDWGALRKSGRADSLWRDLVWAYRFFRASKDYDVVLTGSERPALLLALMQKFLRGRQRVPHVFLECMWNLPPGGLARWKRRVLLRWVTDAADRIVVYARHQIDAYANLLDISKQKLAFVHSHSTLYNREYPVKAGDYLFSGGYTNRDYATLVQALDGVGCRAVLCVGARNRVSGPFPANVEIRTDVQEREFYELMGGSAFVVVPLRDGVLERGGRQVFQNAMAMGKAVIVTDPLATDYITDNVTGLLVPPGNPERLREAITMLVRHPEITGRLGREAQKAAQIFTPEKFFDEVLAIAETTAAGSA